MATGSCINRSSRATYDSVTSERIPLGRADNIDPPDLEESIGGPIILAVLSSECCDLFDGFPSVLLGRSNNKSGLG